MSTLAAPLPASPRKQRESFRLMNGDHLTREEFEKRFDAIPGLKKAELIEGVAYVPPPVSDESHGNPHFDVIGWLGLYAASTPGVGGGDNTSLRLDLDNMPQPDALLRIEPQYVGQVKRDEEGYLIGAPELIVKIAASSANYDLHEKRGKG